MAHLRSLLTIVALVLLLTGSAIALGRLTPGADVPATIQVIVVGALALAGGIGPHDRQDR